MKRMNMGLMAGIFTIMLTACGQKDNSVPVWVEGRECEQNLTIAFRTIVKGKGAPIVKIAASSDYRLLVNGQFAAHGPSVSAHGHYRVDRIDISSLLHDCDNVVGIEVAGYNQPSYYLLNQPSFLQAEICRKSGKVVARTGRDFKAYELGQRRQDVPKFSMQRTAMEQYELDCSHLAWAEDPEWEGEALTLAHQEAKTLIDRGVDYPKYDIIRAAHLCEHPELANCLSGGKVSVPSGTREDTWKFAHNSTGFIGMDVEVIDTCKVTLLFDELLQGDGSVNPRRQGGPLGRVDWTLAPGHYSVESFEPYTMQYVQASLPEGAARVEKIWMRQYVNSTFGKASFHSANAQLDTLFEAARRTAEQNYLDIFMDCPSRERAGWLCDSYFSSRAAFDFSGKCQIEKNFLENFLIAEEFPGVEKGMLPMCYPSDHFGYEGSISWLNNQFIPNWAMFYVIELEEYLHRSGDRELIDRAKERVYGLVEYFKEFHNEYGLLESLRNWVFVEWSDAAKFVQDVSFPTNMLYAAMLESAGRLYGDRDLMEQAKRLKMSICEWSFDGEFFCDNAMRKDGTLTRTDNRTEVCQYYAFAFGTATRETHPELWETLRRDFGPGRTKYPEVRPANAFIGTYLRLEILSVAGLCGQILSESISEYIKMSTLTGTLWEMLTPTASCNHGFAAHLAHVFYRDILGVYDIDPVRKVVTLRIRDCGLPFCSGVIPVGDESVELSWTRDGEGNVSRELKIPAGYRVEEI